MKTDWDYLSLGCPTCPWCRSYDHKMTGAEKFTPGDLVKHDCPKCNKTYYVQSHVEYSYSSRKETDDE